MSLDGCNFAFVAKTSLTNPFGGDPIEINIERGYVGVDAVVNGVSYRFINTHLETKTLGGNPALPFPVPGGILHRPYQQFTNGILFDGTPLPLQLTDIWARRPGKPDGFTCCELEDLSNAVSQHGERARRKNKRQDAVWALAV